jgi:hypothetical protein
MEGDTMYILTAAGLGQPTREQTSEERLLRWVLENGLEFQTEIAGRRQRIKLSPSMARSPYIPNQHPESREYWTLPRDERAKVAVATGMALPRILHRFETSGMKEQLERILGELTDPKTTEGIFDPLQKCLEQHPFARICTKQFDIEPEEIVMDFLNKKGIDFANVQDIKCQRFDTFRAGEIRDCNGAPGERWHCTITIKQQGSTQQRVASLFRCLCCLADGTTAYEWTEPHWSQR